MVVDLGGGLGQNSIHMSTRLLDVKFVVQDHQRIVDQSKEAQPGSAVELQVHDMVEK